MTKLRFWTALSTLLWTLWLSQMAIAHEVYPAIADLEVRDGAVVLTLELNLESYLSGIDLDGLQDTNEADGNTEYDRLRAATPDILAAQLPELLARWNAVPLLALDGEPVSLAVQRSQIPEVGNIDLPRLSRLVLTGPDMGSAMGQRMQISWPQGAGDMVLRQQGVREPFTGYLSGGDVSPPISATGGDAQTGWQAFMSYIPVGFDHILPKGLDHILFVLGLFFLSPAWRPLLWQVTAFTAAHTVTLALGALGWVNVPGNIVEPLIAASIVYVAVENIFAGRLTRWRPLVIFGFGLLHGLGFASVLGDFGLPEAQFVPALLGFNVGVEIGQLTVIALAALAVGWFASRPWYRARISIPASVVIAAVGAFWVVERTLL